jgi:hypothetical protein
MSHSASLQTAPEIQSFIAGVDELKGAWRNCGPQAFGCFLTGSRRNTLNPRFRTLVRRGQLRRHGSSRGAWYQLG